MNILDIYKKYSILSSLQTHQLRAAAVGSFIADHWKNQNEVDKEAITQTLLLHDMGNIIKFDFPKFLSVDEETSLEYWQKVKEDFTQRYGIDEHVATHAIAKEIGVSEKVMYLLIHMGTSNLFKTIIGNNWNVKVVSYADLRCAPLGVVSVNERFDDILKRYQGRNHAHANAEKVEEKRKHCLEVEKQIQTQVKIDLNSITEKTVKNIIQKLAIFALD